MDCSKNNITAPASHTWLQQRVLAWFDHSGRHDLPWQHPRAPYTAWLSEIMLQQTQVTTVIPYFLRFIDRFPTVQDLANADEDTVLSYWAGLGYYARARNLLKAAKILAQGFPSTVEGWEAIPGVGRSTAGAIVAQAFNQHASILDANVKRVLSRFVCEANKDILWKFSDYFTPHHRVADYTQAMMDLGANICKAKPNCSLCPLQPKCRGFHTGTTHLYPAKPKRVQKPVRNTIFMLYQSAQGFAFYKRPSEGIWGGLWSLPENEKMEGKKLFEGRHTFTHFHLDYTVCLQKVETGPWFWYKEPPRGVPAVIQKIFKKYGSNNLLSEIEM